MDDSMDDSTPVDRVQKRLKKVAEQTTVYRRYNELLHGVEKNL